MKNNKLKNIKNEFDKDQLYLKINPNFNLDNLKLDPKSNYLVKKLKHYCAYNENIKYLLDLNDSKNDLYFHKGIGEGYILFKDMEYYYDSETHEKFESLEALISRIRDLDGVFLRDQTTDIDDWHNSESYIPLSEKEIEEIITKFYPKEEDTQLSLL